MDPFEAKIFKGTTTEEKLEIAIKALGQAAKALVLTSAHLSALMDRLELIATRLEAKSWEQAIKAELKKGKACEIKVNQPKKNNNDHWLTVVGIKSCVSLSSATFSDLLLVDPANGQFSAINTNNYEWNSKKSRVVSMK